MTPDERKAAMDAQCQAAIEATGCDVAICLKLTPTGASMAMTMADHVDRRQLAIAVLHLAERIDSDALKKVGKYTTKGR